MGFRCGIVGLPNVGKSTLFNALTQTQAAEVGDFPFCTKHPNIGRVGVPDKRLAQIAEVSHSAKIIPTHIEIVDIAGLIRGASQGEGLGNQFLATIREMDALIHVLRCFDSPTSHVEITVDPLRDRDIVETELLLADLESVERGLKSIQKRVGGYERERNLLERVYRVLEQGYPASTVAITAQEQQAFHRLHLLTAKPVLYILNVGEEHSHTENHWTQKMRAQTTYPCVRLAVSLESELSQIDAIHEKTALLTTFGLTEPALHTLIRQGYALLNLLTFFTTGIKETRAWTIPRHTTALHAAGVIHSDFKRGFIRAETIDWQTYVRYRGEIPCRQAGKVRIESRDYIVQDGDILRFRFHVSVGLSCVVERYRALFSGMEYDTLSWISFLDRVHLVNKGSCYQNVNDYLFSCSCVLLFSVLFLDTDLSILCLWYFHLHLHLHLHLHNTIAQLL